MHDQPHQYPTDHYDPRNPTDHIWRLDALCARVDPEAFFPEKGGSTRPAKQLCWTCPVQDPCLEEALTRPEWFGVWGGLSERERRKLLRQRERDAARPRPSAADGGAA